MAIWAWAVCLVMVLDVALILSGAFFTVDGGNIYHRTALYPLAVALPALALASCLVPAVRHRTALGNRSAAAITACVALIVAAGAVQATYYGLNLVVAATAVGAVLLYSDMQAGTSLRLATSIQQLALARKELADIRLGAASVQVEPHFMGNTLATIHHLCLTDPQRAAGAVERLGGHMDAISDALQGNASVPVSEEIGHVRDYLELRRTASPGRVRYRIDMSAEGFSVPPLSVLTLVENAVEHGITPKGEGGTVVVRTRELDDRFEVEVADDGVGFDAEAEDEADADDGRPHVGLPNTRCRVEHMCGGTLTVKSAPGHGTRAVIALPKMSQTPDVRLIAP